MAKSHSHQPGPLHCVLMFNFHTKTTLAQCSLIICHVSQQTDKLPELDLCQHHRMSHLFQLISVRSLLIKSFRNNPEQPDKFEQMDQSLFVTDRKRHLADSNLIIPNFGMQKPLKSC